MVAGLEAFARPGLGGETYGTTVGGAALDRAAKPVRSCTTQGSSPGPAVRSSSTATSTSSDSRTTATAPDCWSRLRWMAHCTDLGYSRAARKAQIGSGRGFKSRVLRRGRYRAYLRDAERGFSATATASENRSGRCARGTRRAREAADRADDGEHAVLERLCGRRSLRHVQRRQPTRVVCPSVILRARGAGPLRVAALEKYGYQGPPAVQKAAA